jgi:hypothetical protein
VGCIIPKGLKLTVLINLFGSSSAGKSSLMADLFSTLKLKGYSVEMCPEIIKQWAWDGIRPNKYDQYFLMGQEIKQQSRLLGKVEFAISDSPVMQNSFYNWYLNGIDNLYQPSVDYNCMVLEDGHTIVNYFLFRNKPFETKGRYQTAEESDKIAIALFDYLKERNLHPVILEGHDYERVIAILKHLSII